MRISKNKVLSSVLLIAILLSACSPAASQATPTQGAAATRTMPPPGVTVIPAPDVEKAVRAFLEAWQAENYQAMYELLTPTSQDALPLEDFIKRYKDTAISMTLESLDFDILSASTNPSIAQVACRLVYHTLMLGDFTREIKMDLSLEKDGWRVQWDDGLILPELHGGNTLFLDIKTPTRGNIYDRNGYAVAVASDIVWMGMYKGDLSPEQESAMLSALSNLTGKTPESIKALYNNDYTYFGDYVPFGEVRRDDFMRYYDVFASLPADIFRWGEYKARFYQDGGIAPHVTGYVQPIPAEEAEDYLRRGYELDEIVGRAGLELWGENYLLGQRGASLYVNGPQGNSISRLAQVESQPSQSIYMTIDGSLQWQAQQAIAGFKGALVVMERDTGRVLAAVSSPGFDPNAFEPKNFNRGTLIQQADLYNRAGGSGYPLGSVFKIITMAAALESGIFTADDTYNCQHFFTELNTDVPLKDWTYDKELAPSGVLTLQEGLMRSCNPWFYKIGLELYRQNRPTDVSTIARAFGLGSPTGIGAGFQDEAGNMPDPVSEFDAVQQAIGQGQILANPLQVARFIAAVGNGGTLYRPQVIEKITDPDGNPSFTFEPEVQGTLPVKPENLELIQQAMRWVVSSDRGTAKHVFSGLSIPVYGKTGTAETSIAGRPHAWFAGYTDANRADKPDIAFAVIAENAGEGSEIAAPIARRLIEIYFLGRPQYVYPWEVRVGVVRTPEPEETGSSSTLPNNSPAQTVVETPPPPDPILGDFDINLRTPTPGP